MSIRVRELTKTYDTQRAVNGISFEIPSGRVVGFLGPNGAGKSTTMKMITGYLMPDSGEVSVNGRDIRKDLSAIQADIGYLPEHNPLYTEMYVREFLSFAAKLSGVARNVRERVEDIIDRTGLRPEAQKRIHQLSKGYRQRVGLAQALIHNPAVLILDEPTSGLDPNQVSEIRNLIRDISADKTILLSTHIMQEVEAMCDHVIIINKGIIVVDEELNTLRNAHSELFHRVRFKMEMPINLMHQLPGVHSVERVKEGEYRLKLREAEGIEENLFRLAVEQQNILLEQNRERKSLESLFQSLTTEQRNG
ncbi:MAG: gliding motility-associated ABC transporter ATP-binding subunit GldA [Flavobacteriales bacterium]|nr:gliding motility-associated ABC transporter ATP-binding subunit GldA [Flavobacteriales bacterium]